MAHQGRPLSIEITLKPHDGIRGRCSQCQRSAPGYDRLPERRWLFVPLWGIPTYFLYAPRRVECAEHGVVVEHIPWSDGKRPVTCAMMGFLARWARRLSWRETAQVFQTSWEAVYRSVEWFVEWGLAHRELRQVESMGVDEIHWGHGLRADNFLTVIYQIDAHCRRLLWVGKTTVGSDAAAGTEGAGAGGGPRVALCLQRHVEALSERHRRRSGASVARARSFPYHHAFEPGGGSGSPIGELPPAGSGKGEGRAAQAHALAAVAPGQPSTRAGPAKTRRSAGQQDGHRPGLGAEGDLLPLWHYKSVLWAGAFLDYWTERAMRSRLEPMKKVARMLRAHEELLLNWFRAKGEISAGAVEGLNNKIRVVTRRSYGFRTYDAMEMALYHTLGRLPEPESAHRFC